MVTPDAKPARAALREALLDAAEAVVAREGFGAVRARGLTEAVGCALGALYTAYPDMDALMLALKLRILDRLDARVADSLSRVARGNPRNPAPISREIEQGAVGVPTQPGSAAPSPGGDHLPLAMARAYVDFAWNDWRQWEVLFQHRLTGPGELPDWYRERLGGIFARIAGPLGEILPGLSDAGALRLAHSLFAAVHGIVVLGVEAKLGPSSRAETAARAEMVVRAALAGFRCQPGLAEAAGPGDAKPRED